MSQTFNLQQFPVHLGPQAKLVQLPPFTGMDWYETYGQQHGGDGIEGRLVSMHRFDNSWDSWEMHPHGAELVVCTQGRITLYQEVDGIVRTVTLGVGDAIINPPGVWHTADVSDPCTALFITTGLGTEQRGR